MNIRYIGKIFARYMNEAVFNNFVKDNQTSNTNFKLVAKTDNDRVPSYYQEEVNATNKLNYYTIKIKFKVNTIFTFEPEDVYGYEEEDDDDEKGIPQIKKATYIIYLASAGFKINGKDTLNFTFNTKNKERQNSIKETNIEYQKSYFYNLTADGHVQLDRSFFKVNEKTDKIGAFANSVRRHFG